MTTTARDVIARSITMHPSLFADRLYEVSQIHQTAACTLHDCEARTAALAMAKAAKTMADLVIGGDELPEELGFSEKLIAFTAAARLQVIPHAAQVFILAGE